MMWGVHDSPSWTGGVQAMTLTGDYRDNIPAIRAIYDQLDQAGSERACPQLLPGVYSTAAPWGIDGGGGFMERRRAPHENVNAPRPAWTIEVREDGSVFLSGCEGGIGLDELLGERTF